jgi:DNA-directed RNA polymerase specialized sigma24 family protein
MLRWINLSITKSMAPDHQFHTTRWSLLSQVRSSDDSGEARRALAELCQRSWFPVYAFMRRTGATAADAEDRVQGFFEHVLTHRLLERADRGQGRFRSFLLGCLKNYLGNESHKEAAQRRGGHLQAVHLDALEAEERYRLEVESLAMSDQQTFDQTWAHALLERTLAELRAEQKDPAHFDLIAPALTGREDRAGIAALTGMSDGALKVAIHRLRKRYREILRSLVAGTVPTAADVEEELAYLVACLRR